MSALLYLSSKDFDVAQGQQGRVMCNRIRGFSLLLFFSNACHHCKDLLPIFKRLPGTINGCQFGMINVSADKQCVAMSRGTLSEIQYVPYIVMYVDGRPVMKYAGPHDINEIRRFVLEVSKRIKSKQTFANNPAVVKDPRGGIPAYSYGKPLCGPDEKICYLTSTTAYKDEALKPAGQGGVPLAAAAGMGQHGAQPGYHQGMGGSYPQGTYQGMQPGMYQGGQMIPGQPGMAPGGYDAAAYRQGQYPGTANGNGTYGSLSGMR